MPHNDEDNNTVDLGIATNEFGLPSPQGVIDYVKAEIGLDDEHIVLLSDIQAKIATIPASAVSVQKTMTWTEYWMLDNQPVKVTGTRQFIGTDERYLQVDDLDAHGADHSGFNSLITNVTDTLSPDPSTATNATKITATAYYA